MKSRIFLVLVVCLLASGCYDTKNPLSDPHTSKADERLVGVWRYPGEETYYHIGHAGRMFPVSMMRIVEIKHHKGSVEPPEEYLAFPTVLGDKTYLNVVIDGDRKQVRHLDDKGWEPDAVDCYTLFKYQFDGDKLVVFFTDEEAKVKAIKDGKIKGKIESMKPAQFNDTTENVARFVVQAGDSLWDTKETGRFERVKMETSDAATQEKTK